MTEEFDMNKCIAFWKLYSMVTEHAQEKMEDEVEDWLRKMHLEADKQRSI